MKSLSEFMPRCDPSFNELGFDRANFMTLLGRGNDAALTATTTTTKWVRGLYHRQWFSMLEAACIIEGEEPDAFDDCREYNLPSNIKHMQQAIRDALPELETDDDGNVSSRSIDAWCIANGISWPLMERHQSPPVAGTNDAAGIALRLAEAELKAERLAQEFATITAERDKLRHELQGLTDELVSAKKEATQSKAALQKAEADLLQGKSRTSALKLVGGLAMAVYKIPIKSGRLTHLTELKNDLERVGVAISEDVIRNYLNAAAEVV